jgi:hypothetical protein
MNADGRFRDELFFPGTKGDSPSLQGLGSRSETLREREGAVLFRGRGKFNPGLCLVRNTLYCVRVPPTTSPGSRVGGSRTRGRLTLSTP